MNAAALTGITVRPATYEDLPTIAELHVKAWQQAYIGQIDQSYLDSLDAAKRLDMWQQIFSKQDARHGLLLAEVAGHAAGFISYGPPREAAPPGSDVEIGALYTLSPYWSKGVGFRLFTTAHAHFKDQHYKQSYLWVLDTNHRAIESYRRWGGQFQEGLMNQLIGTKNVQEFCVVFDV